MNLTQLVNFVIICFIAFSSFANEKDPSEKYMNQFRHAFSIVEKNYVQDPDKQKIVDSAIRGMLESLDNYSAYLVGEELEDFKKNIDGEFGGIGIQVYPDKAGLKVISPLDDLPAEKAGIKSGDLIIGVDDHDITDERYETLIKSMRGVPGTKVKITIYRAGEKDLFEFSLTREIVKIQEVKASLDDDIAYIRIASFNKNTFNSFIDALAKLKKESSKQIKGIILDLRNNPGGLLDQAIKIASYFIDEGIIVKIQGRKEFNNYSFMTNKLQQKSPKLHVITLINEGSASASEIVAGALQDHKKSIILGTRSFGKGSVQKIIEVDNRSAMKITKEKFYSPNGREIDSNGIMPDIEVKDQKVSFETKKDSLIEKFISKSKKRKNNSDKPVKVDTKKSSKKNVKMSKRYLEDYQYSRAFDLLKSLNSISPI